MRVVVLIAFHCRTQEGFCTALFMLKSLFFCLEVDMHLLSIIMQQLTSLPTVMWQEGRVAAPASHIAS